MIGIGNERGKNEKRKRKFIEENKKIFYRKGNGSNKKNETENKFEEGEVGGAYYNEDNKYIFEGSVKIKNKNKHLFYNKAQVYNRDMSIILIKALEIYLKNKNKDNGKTLFRGFNVIELLSASGIRSIRYVKELRETINHIITNDIDKYACKQIRRNFKRNNINKDKYTILCNDANSVMNILNIDNIYTKKRNNKKLDIGFTYINNIINYNSYFKQALKFLKFLTYYNRVKSNNNESKEDIQDSDSTAFSNNDDVNTKIDLIEDESDQYDETNYNSLTHCSDRDDAISGNESAKKELNEHKTVEGDDVHQDVESVDVEAQNGEQNRKVHNERMHNEGMHNEGIQNHYGKENISESTLDDLIKKSKLMEKYIFDIIDIDPYGSSIEYLESCLKYGRSNFFILITNTDMRILNGKFPDVSFYKYNSMIFSKKVNYNNEYSIRVLFYKIKTIASKYKKCIIPFLSLNIYFYIRILIQVLDDALQTKDLCIDSGLVYQCTNCSSFYINPLASKKDVNVSVTDNNNNDNNDNNNNNNSKRRKKNKKKYSFPNGNRDLLENGSENKKEKLLNTEFCKQVEIVRNGENTENAQNFEKVEKVENGGEATENAKSTIIGYKYKSSKLQISNKCEECGGDILIGGPIYIGKLHNADFILTCISLLENLEEYNLNTIKTRDRILINFRCLKQEINIPLYYNMPALFRNFKICSFSRKLLVNALVNLNYEVSYFHKDPDSVKTNAPNNVFMDIFRAIIYKINSKKRSFNSVDGKNDELDGINNKNCKEGNENTQKKVYSINTIKDEKLKKKLLTYEFFKKNSSFDNINISNYKKDKTHLKLFTIENPEPFWGPMKKHFERN
ncbi:tRNA (guanine(26)-N(2))-dimethyltransferase [Plasmodium brasilianum]|uniref:tRNA (guanine(26)-N(2))-dimethyltransferase n=2 Tax=Plasmodium (Plasmodium) TaxID=418103 RepID=A0A1A8WE90_PLAMA|nr:N2,N2-dimethylguanosine tRNA methyltransferase, putative [Plasmodium malariae]KAI4834749.1 tRNA (guanine(26)-N(2))-dimethyltransferase [Plasmodium brasilianum]SBS90364.1 N2,N2-dimethylguanosine tRNA methyltransferase, putative [Plasmodium malariae]SCP03306.1 N2,N2-dimethylguanosine tRNA methyltransferase, putative [Plasmodium malariae]